MKAIMISDKPKWCALMMNGDKKIEIRKNKALASAIQKLIDEYGYAEIYVYCSKDGGNLVYGTEYRGGSFIDEYGITRGYSKQKANEIFGLLNGKVLFKFRCYKLDRIWKTTTGIWTCGDKIELNFYKDSCLTEEELNQYFKPKQDGFKNQYGGAINISDLEIFDKPKELSEFKQKWYCKSLKEYLLHPIGKAPQNFCYIEV